MSDKKQLEISSEAVSRMLRQYRAHTSTTKEGNKVVRLGRDQVDVFTGDGWANRSRYRVVNGRWAHMAGVRLTAGVIQTLPNVR